MLVNTIFKVYFAILSYKLECVLKSRIQFQTTLYPQCRVKFSEKARVFVSYLVSNAEQHSINTEIDNFE